MAAHTYTVADCLGSTPATDLDAAYAMAVQLLLAGAPLVDVEQARNSPDCWDLQGRTLGEPGLLHRLVPASHPLEPAAGTGSTSTLPPYVWRRLPAATQAALLALSGSR